MNDLGVIATEQQRKQYWADRGLPDPADVVSGEKASEMRTGERVRSPLRDQLDAWFASHPSDRPPYWT